MTHSHLPTAINTHRRAFLVAAGCGLAALSSPASARARRGQLLRQVPPAYRDAAIRAGIPPRQRIRNVDCGPMQVNWRWHGDKLQSFAKALDAHNNLAVGASILASHYRDSGNWFVAAGRYHHPTDVARANAYAQGVFRRIKLLQEAA